MIDRSTGRRYGVCPLVRLATKTERNNTMGYQRYSRDPRWLSARFHSDCAGCSKPVNKGDKAFYFPSSRSIYGDKCGCAAKQSADFDAAAFDEANNACL